MTCSLVSRGMLVVWWYDINALRTVLVDIGWAGNAKFFRLGGWTGQLWELTVCAGTIVHTAIRSQVNSGHMQAKRTEWTTSIPRSSCCSFFLAARMEEATAFWFEEAKGVLPVSSL